MQPICLKIAGDFWDSQIYRGRLYLWTMKGSVAVYDWDALVESLCTNGTRLALTCGLSRGDYLYGADFKIVFADRDVRRLITQKFEKASTNSFELHRKAFSRFLIREVETPFGILHDDTDVYGNQIYALTETGLHSTHIEHSKRVGPFDPTEKLWDGQGNSVRAKSSSLAIAAGDDGLFEVPAITTFSQDRGEVVQVSDRHTLFANWAFASIFGSSDVGDSYLAAFSWHQGDDSLAGGDEGGQYTRHFERLIEDSEMFGQGGLAWGVQDRFYQLKGRDLSIVKFAQFRIDKGQEEPFEKLQSLELQPWKGDAVSGGVSSFGVVIEMENGLIIIGSDGQSQTVDGAVTRWRVFPRSKRYENHLHVIYDDHLNVLSYNHDYFVDQNSKLAGVSHRPGRVRY